MAALVSLLEALVDPMSLFCIGCVLTPLAVERERLTVEAIVEYFTEPIMAVCLLAVPLCGLVALSIEKRFRSGAKKHTSKTKGAADVVKPLTFGERTRARWYLLNGIIIHMLMDGCVGVFKTSRLFAENYAKLDKRYGAPLGDHVGATVHVVSLVELFVKGPICIALYFLFYMRHPARDAVEFFTCVTQAYGTIVYLGQEAISGAPNLDVDYQLSFSQHYLLYFWFAIFFGCVLYLIVPGILGYRAYCRLVRSSALSR